METHTSTVRTPLFLSLHFFSFSCSCLTHSQLSHQFEEAGKTSLTILKLVRLHLPSLLFQTYKQLVSSRMDVLHVIIKILVLLYCTISALILLLYNICTHPITVLLQVTWGLVTEGKDKDIKANPELSVLVRIWKIKR